VVGVEVRGVRRGGDAFEVVSGVEGLRAVGVPDRERARAEGVELVVAVFGGVEAVFRGHVQAPEPGIGVLAEERAIGADGELIGPLTLHVVAPLAGITLVGGDQVGGVRAGGSIRGRVGIHAVGHVHAFQALIG